MKGLIRFVLLWVALAGALHAQVDPQADLWRAAEKGQVPAIARAIRGGAQVDGPDANGWTALMYAVSAGQRAASKDLLNRGADANASAADGTTALMSAVVGGSVAI